MKKQPESKIQNFPRPSKPLADYNDPLRERMAHLCETDPRCMRNGRVASPMRVLMAMTKGSSVDGN